MEKVFARVRSPLEISVAVARTSQSPFPLYAMRKTQHRTKVENQNINENQSNFPSPKFILFSSIFFANAHHYAE